MSYLRAYEVTCAWWPEHPQTIRAESGAKAKRELAYSIADTCDASMGTIFKSLSVRSLEPRLRRPAPTSLDAYSHELLRHAIGYDNPRQNPGWRNRFCASVAGRDATAWEALVAAGLAERGGTINNGQERFYFATEAGIAEACKPAPGGAS